MRFMVTGRQTGKTWQLMDWASRGKSRVVVVHSMQEATRLIREFGPGIDPSQIVSVESLQRLRGRRNLTISVDNLDLILPRLLGANAPVEIVTATGQMFEGGL